MLSQLRNSAEARTKGRELKLRKGCVPLDGKDTGGGDREDTGGGDRDDTGGGDSEDVEGGDMDNTGRGGGEDTGVGVGPVRKKDVTRALKLLLRWKGPVARWQDK